MDIPILSLPHLTRVKAESSRADSKLPGWADLVLCLTSRYSALSSLFKDTVLGNWFSQMMEYLTLFPASGSVASTWI